MTDSLGFIPIKRRNGKETFQISGRSIGANLLQFWQWSEVRSKVESGKSGSHAGCRAGVGPRRHRRGYGGDTHPVLRTPLRGGDRPTPSFRLRTACCAETSRRIRRAGAFLDVMVTGSVNGSEPTVITKASALRTKCSVSIGSAGWGPACRSVLKASC